MHVGKALGPVGTTLKGENVSLEITNDSMAAEEAYLDLMQLCSQFGIDAVSAAKALEQWVKHLMRRGDLVPIQEAIG